MRRQFYDEYGRVTRTRTRIDGQRYDIGRTYDAQSRVATLTYPNDLTVERDYDIYGYLETVTDADASDPIVYWQANARDARGNLVEVALGNGNTTIRDYNAATGYLESVLTGTTLGTEAQSLSFAWDKVGNLVSRTDENQNGLVEDFQYDNLNRLIQATITQGPSYIEPMYVDYDEIGNIVYKSDVGEYNYNTRPHAVSEVIDGPRNATYSYDANGNMTSGADRAIQWTAFNKPRAIVRDANPPSGTFYNGGTLYASNASAFFYGPDRSRYKQLRNQETNDGFLQSTIVYVGGIYEHHDKANAPDEDRAYIQAGNNRGQPRMALS